MSTDSGNRKKGVISGQQRFWQIAKVLKKHDAEKGMTPVRLREILEDLGPTYVKIGQIMSSRQDLIPPEYASELEKLRSDVDPMPWSMVEEEIIKAYHKKPEELFAYIEHEPAGAASMAQVHRAVTKDGERVVLKVQRPDLYEQMAVDVRIMKKAAKLLSLNEVISGMVNLDDVIEEFWKTALEEMDFRHEAANAIRFAAENKDVPYLHLMKIYPEYTKSNMLVMEQIDGIEVDRSSELDEKGYSRNEIAVKLGMNFLDQIIDHGYFHADPHSGNIQVLEDRIVWLDFGMMGELSQGETRAMYECLQALAARDLTRLTDAILQIGIPPDNLNYIGFSNTLDAYLNRYINQSFSSLDLGTMVAEAVEICRKYGIRLPANISMLARSMVTIQGTLKGIDPGVNMLEFISRQRTTIDQIDWQSEIRTFVRDAYASMKALSVLPVKADQVISQMERGRLQVGIKITDLAKLMPQISHLVDRLVVCILIASLLMGSSIICTTNMQPKVLEIPLLGLLGFFISFLLSLWLFYKMLFHPKKGNSLF